MDNNNNEFVVYDITSWNISKAEKLVYEAASQAGFIQPLNRWIGSEPGFSILLTSGEVQGEIAEAKCTKTDTPTYSGEPTYKLTIRLLKDSPRGRVFFEVMRRHQKGFDFYGPKSS